MTFSPTPPNGNFETQNLPIIEKASLALQVWYQALPHMPKFFKHSLGEKITNLFIRLIELLLIAGYSTHDKKMEVIKQASLTLDLLKFFLQIAFRLKALTSKQLADLILPLSEVGKMIGGWQKQISKQTPLV